MNYKPILIVSGEPNSIFFEIFFKSLKKNKFKNPLVVIGSHRILLLQMKKLNFTKKIKIINTNNIKEYILDNKSINLIDVKYNQKKAFDKPSKKSNKYIKNCFLIAIKLLNDGFTNKLINGPVSKKNFLNKKYLGVTEYLASSFSVNNTAMLIYNKKLSVCPVTTHLPLKMVAGKINKKVIYNKILLVNSFYKKKKPDVIVGMYHDQVRAPMKTLFEYDAINITLGLPIIRISPDHGPNEKMLGKNLSNPLSLIRALKFLEKN